MGWALLFGLILRIDAYTADLGREAGGDLCWSRVGRPFADWLYHLINSGAPATGIAPLGLMLAVAILALAGTFLPFGAVLDCAVLFCAEASSHLTASGRQPVEAQRVPLVCTGSFPPWRSPLPWPGGLARHHLPHSVGGVGCGDRPLVRLKKLPGRLLYQSAADEGPCQSSSLDRGMGIAVAIEHNTVGGGVGTFGTWTKQRHQVDHNDPFSFS